MKIVDEKDNNTHLFKNVELGEVFKMNDDSSYFYMKTTSVIDADDGIEYNAVCLIDGDLLTCDDDERVFVYPSSEVIIKR